MITTRKATVLDRNSLVRLAAEFAAEYKLPNHIDAGVVQHYIEQAFIYDATFFNVAVREETLVGFLVGGVSSDNALRIKIAHELAWFVAPDCRSKSVGSQLFTEFEAWARDKQAGYVSVSYNPDIADLDYFYTQRGYWKKEVTYVKTLQ